MKKVVYFILAIALNGNLNAQQAFDAPENAFWHQGSKTWFVSNLGGGLSLAEDNYGWVTRLDADGNVLNAHWVEGLHAPTGMGAFGNTLYVADRGRVAVIDIPSAKIVKFIALPGSQFVNDVAVSASGDVYVSDTYTDRIYRLPNGSNPEVFIESPALEYPNGLWCDGNILYLGSWGPMTDRNTFAVSHLGSIYAIDINTKKISPVGKGKPIATIDGIVRYKNNFYITDWTRGRLLKVDDDGNVTEVLKGFSQLADLGIDSNTGTIMLVEMSSNRTFLFKIN